MGYPYDVTGLKEVGVHRCPHTGHDILGQTTIQYQYTEPKYLVDRNSSIYFQWTHDLMDDHEKATSLLLQFLILQCTGF